jgi:hypothetical protein
MTMEIQAQTMSSTPRREPWNKGKLIGRKPPLRPKHVWSIRTRLQIDRATVRQKKTGGDTRSRLGERLVGDQQFRREALLLEKLAHQPQYRSAVAAALDQHVQDLALMVVPKPGACPQKSRLALPRAEHRPST